MSVEDPTDTIRRVIAERARPRPERRVTPDRRACASNAGPVIVVVGNGNVVAPPADWPSRRPRRTP